MSKTIMYQFEIKKERYHQDDCKHKDSEYMFSFVRFSSEPPSREIVTTTRVDVYRWQEVSGEYNICMRTGVEGEYISSHYQSFLTQGAIKNHPAWDVYGFTHDMLWLIAASGLDVDTAASRMKLIYLVSKKEEE